MNNTEYYKELITYRITNYDFYKGMDLKEEEIKASMVKSLQEMVDNLKEIAKTKPIRQGKIIRLKAG